MYDLIVIGSGPAGYVAAERAGQLGKKVLIVERSEHLGGVCLNTGCIPTKSMLYSAKLYNHTLHGEAFGVTAKEVTFDYARVKARTEGIQKKLRGGIAFLMKHAKADVVRGAATVTSPNSITCDGTAYEGANLLICTGSEAAVPPIEGLKGNDKVVTNVGILAQERMVDHLCIIGAGVIGTEFACLYANAGKKVTAVEMLPQICGNTEADLTKIVQKSLEKKGVAFFLNATVEKVEGSRVTFRDAAGKTDTVDADLVLVATGRTVNTTGFGLEAIGVDMDRGGIKVNDRAQTNVPGVWAAGDVTGRWQLAHFASRQATVAVNVMFGREDTCREDAVPAVVYTDPEIASVGLTEAMAAEQGIPVKTGTFNMGANGRFLAETNGERGICKVVAGAERGTILGVHMVAPYASEMIAAAAALIETELRGRDVEELIFPHPTMCEAMHDAAFSLR